MQTVILTPVNINSQRKQDWVSPSPYFSKVHKVPAEALGMHVNGPACAADVSRECVGWDRWSWPPPSRSLSVIPADLKP